MMGLGIALGAYTNEYNNQRRMRRDDETHAMQKEQFDWKREERDQEQEYKTKVSELAETSPMRNYEAQVQQWEAGGRKGAQPQPPSPFEMLNFNSRFADLGLQYGKYNPEIVAANAKTMQHMISEGYLDGLKRLRMGDIAGAQQLFNSSGNERVDMSAATPVQVDYKGADGKVRKVTAYRMPDGAIINPDEALDALIPMEKLYELSIRGDESNARIAALNRPRATGGGRQPSAREELADALMNAETQDEVEQIVARAAMLGYGNWGDTQDDEGNIRRGPASTRTDAIRRRSFEESVAAAAQQSASTAPAPTPQAQTAPVATQRGGSTTAVQRVQEDRLSSLNALQLRAIARGGPGIPKETQERAAQLYAEKIAERERANEEYLSLTGGR